MELSELFTLENLIKAFGECSRISHWKYSTQLYKSNLLLNLVELQSEILQNKYKVSPTTNFTINERGKIRNIEAPKMRDRIVQKVICKNILIPNLSKLLIYDNYASQKDRGTSHARKRIEVLLRRYIRKHGTDGYIMQIDVKRYFESVDHETLKHMIHDKIKETPEIMNLIDYIIDSSSRGEKGLNLGSEAPQIFAIYYLSKVDNYIKTVKDMKYYGRYMDDMFVISDSKEKLKELLEEIKDQLKALKLEVNEKKTHITKLSHGFTFMQIKYSLNGNKIIKRPTRNKIARERRRLKRYKKKCDQGEMTGYDIRNCYMSWRNNIRKDCNKCERTIKSMDNLFNELFPNIEDPPRKGRKDIIKETAKMIAEGGFYEMD